MRFNTHINDLTEQTSVFKELKNVNDRLVASEKLKSNFLSNIRNEINNPLAAILELSKNISEDSLSIEQIKKFSKIIHSEIFNLDFQLRNIFVSAEIESGELGISVVSVNVSKVIQNVINSFQHLINKKNLIIFSVNGISENSFFYTDAEKLHLIISNLISNAIQFSTEDGTIEINSSMENGLLKVFVKDNGVGISDDNRKLMFDRFRQGQEGSTKNFAGHGLGLSVCNSLLEIIDGKLIVDSELYKGSSFAILLKEASKNTPFEGTYSDDGNDFLFEDNNSAIF